MKIKYTISLKNGKTYHAGAIEHVGTFLILHDIRECWHKELRIPTAEISEVYMPMMPEHVADLSNQALINLILIAILGVLLLIMVFTS